MAGTQSSRNTLINMFLLGSLLGALFAGAAIFLILKRQPVWGAVTAGAGVIVLSWLAVWLAQRWETQASDSVAAVPQPVPLLAVPVENASAPRSPARNSGAFAALQTQPQNPVRTQSGEMPAATHQGTGGMEPRRGPLFDPSVLENLKSAGPATGAPFISRLIGLFLSDTERILRQMHAALDMGDSDTLARLAHRLKSGTANVGALQMMEACKQLQTLAGSPAARQVLEDLDRLFSNVRPLLIAYQESLGH